MYRLRYIPKTLRIYIDTQGPSYGAGNNHLETHIRKVLQNDI